MTQPRTRHSQSHAVVRALILVSITSLWGCAGDFKINSIRSSTKASQAQLLKLQSQSDTSVGVHISLKHTESYTLLDPNANGCAGDLKTYGWPFTLGSNGQPLPFPADPNSAGTLKPSFVSQVSTSLTNSGIQSPWNRALSCSLGAQSSTFPNSNCAAFDVGPLYGISTDFGGSSWIVGGNANSRTYSMAHILGVDALPATAATNPASQIAPNLTSASEPISALLSLGESSVVPSLVGARAAGGLSAGRVSAIAQGGETPNVVGGNFSSEVSKTWLFETQSQTWQEIVNLPTSHASIRTRYDRPFEITSNTYGNLQTFSKQTAAVSEFGFFPAAWMGIDRVSQGTSAGQFDTFGTTPHPGGAVRDTTDRLIIAGGFSGVNQSGQKQYSKDIYKFNPSFAPEKVDVTLFDGTTVSGGSSFGFVTQWLEPYPSQPLNNINLGNIEAVASGQIDPPGAAKPLANSAMGVFYNSTSKSAFVTAFGGDDGNNLTPISIANPGSWAYLAPPGSASSVFSYLPTSTYNLDSRSIQTSAVGTTTFPTLFQGIEDIAGGNTFAGEWRGFGFATNSIRNTDGASLLPFVKDAPNTPLHLRHGLVYFGGTNCRDFIENNGALCSVGASGPQFNSETAFVYFDPGFQSKQAAGNATVKEAFTTGNPKRAGMAAAAGLIDDASLAGGTLANQQLLVAWGGIRQTNEASPVNANTIFYMTPQLQRAGTPWSTSIPSGDVPPAMVRASMAFSHLTKKFYLFGGKIISTGASSEPATSDIYELSQSCTRSNAQPISPDVCAFTWRRMTPSGVIPAARWGAGFAEVDYNNTNPTFPFKTCPVDAPCSYALFMQGGSLDGTQVLGDRYTFDPSADAGQGHWFRVDDFPPRQNAAMASFQITDPRTGVRRYYGMMFGGEFGIQQPGAFAGNNGNYFVKPTLGDTWTFDFEPKAWKRTELLGRGVQGYTQWVSPNNPAEPSEWELRQAFDVETADADLKQLSVMSPPPLAGATMFVRANKKRPLPELYLVGGRDKKGVTQTFQSVYKFCPFSTGENPDPVRGEFGTCDAFDPDLNTDSPSPRMQTPTGRWLYKQPTSTGDAHTGYLAASAYDSRRDKGLVWGGLRNATTNPTAVTQTTQLTASNSVLEYTFPTVSNDPTVYSQGSLHPNEIMVDGGWAAVPPCNLGQAPTPRYGHVMFYDGAADVMVVAGGKDVAGNILTQSWLANGSNAGTMPDVWAGKRKATCYEWRRVTTFGNTLSGGDLPSQGWFNAASVGFAATSLRSGYYTLDDAQCVGLGPIASPDPSISSLNAGGVTIDLDRTQLPSTENILMHVTYLPFGKNTLRADGGISQPQDRADLRIHLVQNGWSAQELSSLFQPRHLAFYQDLVRSNVIVNSYALAGPPGGGVREESIVLPLSAFPQVNRVWLERVSGSAILISVKLYRLGRR